MPPPDLEPLSDKQIAEIQSATFIVPCHLLVDKSGCVLSVNPSQDWLPKVRVVPEGSSYSLVYTRAGLYLTTLTGSPLR